MHKHLTLHISLLLSCLPILGCGGESGSAPDADSLDAEPLDASFDAAPVDAAPALDAPRLDSGLDGGASCGSEIEALLSIDRVLSLTGSQTVTLPSETCTLSRVCVSDTASLFVAGTASLLLTGSRANVISGLGVSSIDTNLANLTVTLTGTADTYIVVENQDAPFELFFDAPTHTVTVLVTGTAGLMIDGAIDTLALGGDPSTFPTCP